MSRPYKEHGEYIREQMVEAIVRYVEEHQYAPTVREIGEMVGLKSSSSVQAHLNRLLVEGKIETDAGIGTPRALRVPGYKFVKEEQVSE